MKWHGRHWSLKEVNVSISQLVDVVMMVAYIRYSMLSRHICKLENKQCIYYQVNNNYWFRKEH